MRTASRESFAIPAVVVVEFRTERNWRLDPGMKLYYDYVSPESALVDRSPYMFVLTVNINGQQSERSRHIVPGKHFVHVRSGNNLSMEIQVGILEQRVKNVPRRALLNVETLLPIRKYEARDRELPIVITPKVDILDPPLTPLTTDKLDPSRSHCRTDTDEPTSMTSITDDPPPTTLDRVADTLLPSRRKLRTLALDP